MSAPAAVVKLLERLEDSLERSTLVKLTLGGPCGADATLRSVFIRRVDLREGPRLSFVFRHDRKDITLNLPFEEGVRRAGEMIGRDFHHAHLFTTEHIAELEWRSGQPARFRTRPPRHSAAPAPSHDRAKQRWVIPQEAPWLAALGVTTAAGAVCDGMAAKFRQIQKFTEILSHLLEAAPVPASGPLSLLDMGCGKGYLTFAAYELLRRRGGAQARVRGVEARPELADLCERAARQCACEGLSFQCATIAQLPPEPADILVALHACDTATDDALARGIQAGAALILAAPCCHKELRPLLAPPAPLAGVLRHGILLERQAEFATDALRAALLEWAGYETRVFEFIDAGHTAKNLMIAGIRRPPDNAAEDRARAVRDLAAFYGVRSQHLAGALGFQLAPDPGASNQFSTRSSGT